jgi:hypothetical protein
MRIPIQAAVAVGVALMPVGYVQAAKSIHKSHKAYVSSGVQGTPAYGYTTYGYDGGNAAAGGNNANSMSGSNSAVENPNGRTNCC